MIKYRLMDMTRRHLEDENLGDKDHQMSGMDGAKIEFESKIQELLKEEGWDYLHVKITARSYQE